MAKKKRKSPLATFSLPSDQIKELEAYLQAIEEIYEKTNKSAVVGKALKAWIRGKLADDEQLNAAFTRILGTPKIRLIGKS
jgi:hypothetical protein